MSDFLEPLAGEKVLERKLYGSESAENLGTLTEAGLCAKPDSTVRVLALTEEILEYKSTAGDAVLEIGKRLREAKNLLLHGEWLPWLEEKVEFSERTAQRFIRLSESYTNPTTLSDLGASKALQLLALSPIDREEFMAEKHAVGGQEKAVEEMSHRELEQALRDRDEAVKAKEMAEAGLENSQTLLEEVVRQREGEKLRFAEAEKAGAERVKDLQSKLKDTKEKAKIAQSLEQQAKQALEDLRKTPLSAAARAVDPETLDKLRTEAEEAATERVRAANTQAAEATARAEQAESEVEAARKQLALSDKTAQAFRFHFDEWQRKYNDMCAALTLVAEDDGDKAARLKLAIRAAAEQMGGGV